MISQPLQTLSGKILLLLLVSFFLVLAGCGGGSSSPQEDSNASAPPESDESGPFSLATRSFSQQVEVDWDADPDSAYHLYWSTDSSFDLDSHAHSADAGSALNVEPPVRVEGLDNGENWYFIVEKDGEVVSSRRGAFPGAPNLSRPPEISAPMTVAQDHLFIGGSHTRFGYINDALMLVQRETGHPAESLGVSGRVHAVTPDGKGGYFIGGTRMSVGDQDGLVLLRLDENLEVDTDWLYSASSPGQLPAQVDRILLTEDSVFVAGFFSEFGGENVHMLASLDRETGAINTGFAPNPDGWVWTLASVDDRLLIGGSFTQVANNDLEGIALLTHSGGVPVGQPDIKLDLQSNNPPNRVFSIIRYADNFLVGGGFTSVGPDQDMDYVVTVTPDGAVEAPPVTANGSVYSMDSNQDYLAILGYFDQVNGADRSGFALLTSDLNLTELDPLTGDHFFLNVNESSQMISIYGDQILLTGVNDRDLERTNFLIEIDANTGVTDFAIRPGTGLIRQALHWNDDLLLVAGNEGIGNAYEENALLVVDSMGTHSEQHRYQIELPPFRPVLNGLDSTDQGQVYITGGLSEVDGLIRLRNFSVNADASLSNTWTPKLEGGSGSSLPVGLALQYSEANDLIYIGGLFNETNNDPAEKYLTALTTNGQVDGTFNPPDFNDRVEVLLYWDDTLLTSGRFTTVNSEQRPFLAALNGTTGALEDWEPTHTAGDKVHTFAPAQDGFFIGGEFEDLDQTTGLDNVAFYEPQVGGGYAPRANWVPAPDGPVYAVAQIGDFIWVGGAFEQAGGQNQAYLAPLNADGELVTTSAPFIEGSSQASVRGIHAFDDKVCFTGNFNRVNGEPRGNLACIYPEDGRLAW